MGEYTRFVGLDVHRDTISIAVAEPEMGEPEFVGRIANTPEAVSRWLRRAETTQRGLSEVLMCYEAGPCGYTLYRQLAEQGLHCEVIAPGLIPRRPSDRVKTDRRDASQLARLLRAGELTPIWVPTPEEEAFRSVLRAREQAVTDRARARQQLGKLLLCCGVQPPAGVKPWTQRHARWLNGLPWSNLSYEMVFREHCYHLQESMARVARHDAYITQAVASSPWRAAIAALACLRGVEILTAATVCYEIGAIARFVRPTELMSYTGLVPGEDSSGSTQRHLGITKAGNRHLRRVLVEAAWHYRWPARVGPTLQQRLHGQPGEVAEISWRAQTRLHGRYRSLLAHGKDKNVAVVAVARELVGFMWEILQHVPLPTRLAAEA